MDRTLKLGTRGSALALWQANWTKSELEKRWPGLSVELVPIKTTGDKILDVPLAKIGGKGLFTKEIDEALVDGRIDLAVHSMKDVPFQLPDGIILAVAGLKRLGHESRITQILDDDIMVSAVGQGALGIVCRTGDDETRSFLEALDHAPTHTAVTAERGLLRALGGSCQVPIAGRAKLVEDTLSIKGLIASLDGSRVLAEELTGSADHAQELGLELGRKLLARGAGEILAEIAQYGAD